MKETDIIVSVLPEGYLDDPLVASVTRIDANTPELVSLGFLPGEVTTARILDAFALLGLDKEHNLLKRVILPYQPPQFFFARNGLILQKDGEELSRTWHAILRIERVRLRNNHRKYIEKVKVCCQGKGPDCSRIGSSHPHYHPGIDAYSAPNPPDTLFEVWHSG